MQMVWSYICGTFERYAMYLELSQGVAVGVGIGEIDGVRVRNGDVPLLGDDEIVE